MTKKDFIWKLAYLAIAGGVFMIDQTTKAWAIAYLAFRRRQDADHRLSESCIRGESGRRVLDAR